MNVPVVVEFIQEHFGMAAQAEPLSIESLLQRQNEEHEAASKPKFLSKEEHAKIAIAKHAAELREQLECDEKL
ncbi:hypothetical protein BDR05DRAFT_998783 [Suillus weaverae]|nr:hypothetical protein BDR05DRAFT_998783 [Suillus weaverae]